MMRIQITPHWGVAQDTDEPVDTTALLTLLAAIQESGAIAQAARSVGLSYRHAWGQVKRAEALFGHPADVALTHRADLVVPPAYRDMHWAGFNRTIGTMWAGHDSWGDIEGLHRDGNLVALQVLLTPLRDEAEIVRGVFAMFRRRPTEG